MDQGRPDDEGGAETMVPSDPTVELRVLRDGVERRRRDRGAVACLTVLYHPDLRRVGERVELPALGRGGTVRLSRHEPLFRQPGGEAASPLSDPYLSRSPVVLAGLAGGAVRLVAEGSPTPVVADGLAVDPEAEISPHALGRGVVLLIAGRVVLLLHRRGGDAAEGASGCAPFGLVGDSEAMAATCREIRRVADLEVPVLVRGPTGSGKELAARAVHDASRRRHGPWVSVNLAAVPASLAASELFGAVKGAYTGSVRAQTGFFQRADGGTLFLDEVGDAPPEVQAALLRVLESGEIQRVGSQAPLAVDVRLVAATDADLEAAAEEGSFKQPLLHRLAGYEISMPSLAERRDDFGRLFVHFLRHELEAVGEAGRLALRQPVDEPWLPASIVARLARHDWPGNVRQLRNVARQLAVAGRGSDRVRVTPRIELLLREAEAAPAPPPAGGRAGGSVHGDDPSTWQMPVEEPRPAAGSPPARGSGDDTPPRAHFRPPSDVGEDELEATLRAHHWEVKPTAEALGVSRPSLYNLIAKSPRVRKVADLGDDEIEAAWEAHAGDLDAMHRHLEVSRSGLRQRLLEMRLSASE